MSPRLNRLGMELLEGRECPSVNLAFGILTVTGDGAANTLVVKQSGDTITAQGQTFDAAAVTRVVITGLGGRDVIRNNTTKPGTLYGGPGPDTVIGGSSQDKLYGGHGGDTLYGYGANDILFGGAGIDTLRGGAGSDAAYQGSPGASRSISGIEKDIVHLINAERLTRGTPALKVNLKLNAAAFMHSSDMAMTSDRAGTSAALEHYLTGTTRPQILDRFDAAGYDQWTYAFYYGENIAYGYTDAASLVSAWMGDTSNRDNILRYTYSNIGVSVTQDSLGTPFFTVVFGRRL